MHVFSPSFVSVGGNFFYLLAWGVGLRVPHSWVERASFSIGFPSLVRVMETSLDLRTTTLYLLLGFVILVIVLAYLIDVSCFMLDVYSIHVIEEISLFRM